MKTIVSITPLALSKDSRTLKVALSFARFGYRSLVIEFQKSLDKTFISYPIDVYHISDFNKNHFSNLFCSVRELDQNRNHIQRKKRNDFISGSNCLNIFHSCRFFLLDFLSKTDKKAFQFYYKNPKKRYRQLLINGYLLGKHTVERILMKIAWLIIQSIIKSIESENTSKSGEFSSSKKKLIKKLSLYLKIFQNIDNPFLSSNIELYYIHGTQWPNHHFFLGFLNALVYNKPFFYDAHDFYPVLHSFTPELVNFERICIGQASEVITVNEGIAELMRKTFNCNPVILRNSQDPRVNIKPEKTIREKLNLSDKKFLIICVGQYKEGMAIEELLQAFINLPEDCHLAFLGQNYQKIAHRIKSLKLSNNVHIVPEVLPQEVVEFISSADAGIIIYYSLNENYRRCLPNGFFQTVLAGLPLLLGDLPEIKKIVDTYNIGLYVDVMNADSIREGIMKLYSNRILLQNLKKNVSLAQDDLIWEKDEVVLKNILQKYGL